MAQTLQLGPGASGKTRSFGTGFGLAVITFGIYHAFWYYLLNAELRDVGKRIGDRDLAESKPGMSVLAIVLGGMLLVPPYISIWQFTKRIQRAEALLGVPEEEQLKPGSTFLLLVPGSILIIPAFFYYARITRHQNRVVELAAARDAPSLALGAVAVGTEGAQLPQSGTLV